MNPSAEWGCFMAALAVVPDLSFPAGLTLPCFYTPESRVGQFLLPLSLIVPDHALAAAAEGMLRLPIPRGLRLQLLRPYPPLPDVPLTPVMAQVEAAVRRRAIARQPMPGNPVLGELIGGRGRQTAARALDRLIKAGRLRLEIGDGRRRVVLPDTGQATGWGPYAKGVHAPHSRRPRGTARRAKPVRPDIKPADVGEPARYRIEPARLVAVGPSATCCWPLWPSGAISTDEYCNQPVTTEARKKNRSYCPAHEANAYPPTRDGNKRNQS